MARPAEVSPPGELMYSSMSRPGSSASRYRSCAVTTLATVASIAEPRKMMRSLSSRE
jgi:hypothetical protein